MTATVSIVQRGKSSFRVRTRWRDPLTGKWEEQNETVRGVRETAEARKAEILHDFKTGKVRRLAADSVEKYLNDWVEFRFSMKKIGVSSYRIYKTMLRLFTNDYGSKPLVSINRDTAQEWFEQCIRSKGVSATRYTLTIVKTAFKDAVRKGLLSANPFESLDSLPAPEAKRGTLDSEQVATLWNESYNHGDAGFLTRIALDTGARRGEIAALTWGDISPDGVVSISKTVIRGRFGDYDIAKPKTTHSNRRVTVSAVLRDEFNARRGEPGDFLIAGAKRSDLVTPERVSEMLRRVMEKAGIVGFTAHDLRHAHATHLLRSKLSPPAVSRRLGHSKVSTTLDLYGHAIPEDEQVIVDALDKVLRKKHGPAEVQLGPKNNVDTLQKKAS